MVSAEINWPTVELLNSVRSLAPVTVTTSLAAPTRSAMFTSLIWSTLTGTLSRTVVSNPFALAVTL